MELSVILPMLKRDLKSIGLPVEEVDIQLANKYSKTYYALYYPSYENKSPRIKIYPYRIPNSGFTYPYKNILDTAIHEMCHHMQWRDPLFVRVRGVVHNEEFWVLYNKYINRAETVGLLGGEESEVEDVECSEYST